jgi:hypothetical protein
MHLGDRRWIDSTATLLFTLAPTAILLLGVHVFCVPVLVGLMTAFVVRWRADQVHHPSIRDHGPRMTRQQAAPRRV